jgi:hypothetical protein
MNNIQEIVTLISSIVGIILSVFGFIWNVVKDWDKVPPWLINFLKKSSSPVIAWVLLFVVSGLSVYLIWLKPSSDLPAFANRLITYHDFDGSDPSFPGSMTSEVATDYALTGQSSLRVTTSVRTEGEFKSFLRRSGTFTGNGVTIYVLAPELTDISINYIQLCIPSAGWTCSDGTQLVAGEWTPITIDLSKSDEKGNPVYKQKITEIAVQWRFDAKAATSLDLYFDSVEIFYSGS